METSIEYFVPEIEDIHVGYECELNQEGKWYPLLFTGYEITSFFKEKSELRVPYLTREQIETEGWKYHSNSEAWECPIFRKGNWMLFFNTNEIWIQLGNQMKYDGPCKDINTFRKICQLLGINQ